MNKSLSRVGFSCSTVFAIVGFCSVGTAHCANVTWVGPDASFWDVTTNWDPGPPTAADDVLLGAFNTSFRSLNVGVRSFAGTRGLTISSGGLSVTQASSVGTLSMTGGALGGLGDVTISDGASITYGSMHGSGTTTVRGSTRVEVLSLDGGRIFRNEGITTQTLTVDMNWISRDAMEGGNGTVVNAKGAIWNSDSSSFGNWINASSQGPEDTGAAAVFTNHGTFNTVGGRTTVVTTAFNNTGIVNVEAGRLRFDGGTLTQNGTLIVAAGATLDYAGGERQQAHTFDPVGTTLHGTLSISDGAIVNFSAPFTIDRSTASFRQITSRVMGADLTIGPMASALLVSAMHSGPGTTTVQGTAMTTGLYLDGGRIFRNEGVTTLTGHVDLNSGNAIGNGTVVNARGATWNSDSQGFSANSIRATRQNEGDTGEGAVFTNIGTFNHIGPGSISVSTGFDNLGRINVKGGSMSFLYAFDNRGEVNISAGAMFGAYGDFANNGRIEGRGLVLAPGDNGLVNKGVIAPGDSTGTLNFLGNLTMAAESHLQFQLTSLADFDKIGVTDAVSLGGKLEVLNLGYSPILGDAFKIISFKERLSSTVFSEVTWSGFSPDVAFSVTYNLNDVTLNVTAVPEPSTWALGLIGGGIFGAAAMRRRRGSMQKVDG